MNSKDKHDQQLQDLLTCYRMKFAGAKRVMCAFTHEDHSNVFDFSEVKPEDITFGVHGENYVKVMARNIASGEKSICYIRYFMKEARILPEVADKDYIEWNESISNHLIEVQKNLPETLDKMNFETFVTDYCNNLAKLLIKKNKSYGNSALDPVRIFSTADSEEQIKIRIDDKLSRIKRGNNNFNEDTIQDLQGYLILLQYKKSQE